MNILNPFSEFIFSTQVLQGYPPTRTTCLNTRDLADDLLVPRVNIIKLQQKRRGYMDRHINELAKDGGRVRTYLDDIIFQLIIGDTR